MTRICTPAIKSQNDQPARARKPTPRVSGKRIALPTQRKTCPTLRLSPTAWAKLLFLRDLGETEVGGFGIAAAEVTIGLAILLNLNKLRKTVNVDDINLLRW